VSKRSENTESGDDAEQEFTFIVVRMQNGILGKECKMATWQFLR
jgi:hypothetical protein